MIIIRLRFYLDYSHKTNAENEQGVFQPSKVLKVNASLNELVEVTILSLKDFLNLQTLDLSLNKIERQV